MSRQDYPKQFTPLVDGRSLFQITLRRFRDYGKANEPWVICNETHRFISRQQAIEAGVEIDTLLVEPVGRNTAPAIAVASLALAARDPEAIMMVAPSDHAIADPGVLFASMEGALPAVADGKLITFGIAPDRPATGYGYIRQRDGGDPCPVERFVEKPTEEVAQGFLNEGCYLWNSGMFLFSAKAFLSELETHAPEVLAAAKGALDNAVRDLDFVRLDKAAFESAPNLSVDYAVMEKTGQAMVTRLDDAGWTDVGDWSAFDAHFGRPQGDGTWRGKGDRVFSEGSADNFVWATDGRVVGLVGVSGLTVVATPDALLVVGKGKSQDIKGLVARIEKSAPEVCRVSPRVYRPWGWYESLTVAPRFQVKRLRVWPGQKLSLQMHHHRSEHWVVVEGTARVTVDGAVTLLSENESTYIPVGAAHRLENPGKMNLTIIEAQVGAYLGEDDIVRIEDDYARGEGE